MMEQIDHLNNDVAELEYEKIQCVKENKKQNRYIGELKRELHELRARLELYVMLPGHQRAEAKAMEEPTQQNENEVHAASGEHAREVWGTLDPVQMLSLARGHRQSGERLILLAEQMEACVNRRLRKRGVTQLAF